MERMNLSASNTETRVPATRLCPKCYKEIPAVATKCELCGFQADKPIAILVTVAALILGVIVFAIEFASHSDGRPGIPYASLIILAAILNLFSFAALFARLRVAANALTASAWVVIALFVAFYISTVTRDRPTYATGFDRYGSVSGTYTPDAVTENEKFQVGLGFVLIPGSLGILGMIRLLKTTEFWKEKELAA